MFHEDFTADFKQIPLSRCWVVFLTGDELWMNFAVIAVCVISPLVNFLLSSGGPFHKTTWHTEAFHSGQKKLVISYFHTIDPQQCQRWHGHQEPWMVQEGNEDPCTPFFGCNDECSCNPKEKQPQTRNNEFNFPCKFTHNNERKPCFLSQFPPPKKSATDFENKAVINIQKWNGRITCIYNCWLEIALGGLYPYCLLPVRFLGGFFMTLCHARPIIAAAFLLHFLSKPFPSVSTAPFIASSDVRETWPCAKHVKSTSKHFFSWEIRISDAQR